MLMMTDQLVVSLRRTTADFYSSSILTVTEPGSKVCSRTMRKILLTRTRYFVGGALSQFKPLPLHPTPHLPRSAKQQGIKLRVSRDVFPGRPGLVRAFFVLALFLQVLIGTSPFDVPGYIVKYGKARLLRYRLPRLNSGCTGLKMSSDDA